MSTNANPAASAFKSAYRAFRIAHSQIPIMAENGIAIRMQEVSNMRKITGKWDCPRPRWASHNVAIQQWQKIEYSPTAAFRRWMKAN